MKIGRLQTNHLENPLGYEITVPVLSWVVLESTGKRQQSARVEVSLDGTFDELVFDTGRNETLSSLGVKAQGLELKPCTRYFWRVSVWAEDGDFGVSPTAWFETGKMAEKWKAKWIQSPGDKEVHPLFYKRFHLDKKVKSARIYACGLGIYEMEINGKKVGEEYLAPFYNDYNLWLQYQTYDITPLLEKGDNAIGAMVGNGWYKGRFGFIPEFKEIYGKQMAFLCELHIEMRDGSVLTFGTDETWRCHPSPVLESSIYDGEVWDAEKEIDDWSKASCDEAGFVPVQTAKKPKGRLVPRLSVPVKIMERRKPKELLKTPAGELVLDFGQVITGWVEFETEEAKGAEICLQYGELLQHDNFYNENLRTAKEEYRYRSDGTKKKVRPHFTFYGFRYVKVEGMETVDLNQFTACVIYSELKNTGTLKTSNRKVNRLIQNAVWGQKGNFLDTPTDCPQRDERMGWTGDAQVFAATATFNMDTAAFYKKFLRDVLLEQKEQGGAVPNVVPDILGEIRRITKDKGTVPNGSCGWGDAATVIPWTMYLFYGDRALLEEQYENMCLWVNFIRREDEEKCGGRRLWTCGFHYGDWLALDNPDKKSSFGGTETWYVASAYYYYSAMLTARAARVLGKEKDADVYEKLAAEVKEAIQKEYFTPAGRLAVGTQTAMVLALYMDLVPAGHKERLIGDLTEKLEKDNLHLTTGFLGTPYLCPTLSENGHNDYAYTLLLNEDFPSWLYEVNMGATTIWERWNSVLPDGLVSDTGMNSMNHYAYGSILEWMYRYMCGMNPTQEAPGFKEMILSPHTDKRIRWAAAEYKSASGTYRCRWEIKKDRITYQITVPFDARAQFVLEKPVKAVKINGKRQTVGENQKILLEAGEYNIEI